MKIAFLTILLFISFLDGNTQELSLYDLYEQTQQISELSNLGEYLEALDKADEALKQYADFEGADRYKAYLYLYKATSFMALGDLMLARHCDSLAFHYSQTSKNRELGFLIRNNIAVIEMNCHNYEACYKQCLSLINEPDFHPGEDEKLMILNNMALSAHKLELYEVADSLYPLLISKASSGHNFDAFDPALAYRNFGQYLMKRGDYHQAKNLLHAAIEFYRDSLGEVNPQTGQTALYLGQCYQLLSNNDSAGFFLDEAVQILDQAQNSSLIVPNEEEAIQVYLGRAWFNNELGYTDLAIVDIETAMQKIDKVMNFYSGTKSGVILAGLVRPVYNLAVALYVKIAREKQDSQLMLRAVICSDRGKHLSLQARSLLLNAKPWSDEREQAYKNYFRARLAIEQPDESAMIEKESSQFSEAKALLDSLTGLQALHYLSSEGADFRIRDLPRPLLVIHDLDSLFGVFKISKSIISYHEVPLTNELADSIQVFKGLLAQQRSNNYSRQDLEEFIKISGFLCQHLYPVISPMRSKRLYIQTDGILHGFPFEALLDSGYNLSAEELTPEFRDLPYLFGDRYIHYIVSLQKKINISADSDWIQFSGHSSVDIENYQSSELSGGYDWFDILQQDYRGRSVFLNSCETGVGSYKPGEGLMSLGTAFLLSGANQVIETRWKYPEAPAKEISRLFFRYNGFLNPARALHKARQGYLRACPAGTDHPHYWAGISVQGYGYSGFGFLFYLIIGLAILIYLGLRFKNK